MKQDATDCVDLDAACKLLAKCKSVQALVETAVGAGNYKQALAAAAPDGTMLIKRSMGMPGRTLRSPFAEHIVAREAAGAEKAELLELVAGRVNALGTDEGRLEESFVWAGQCVGLIHDVPPAGEVIRRMVAEAEAGIARLRVIG